MKLYIILLTLITSLASAQPVPASEENIPYLVTFGKTGDKSWGDDDHSQTFFFVVPTTHTAPVYLRVYDPDTGGDIDEIKGGEDTKTKFSIYGGKGCITHADARKTEPVGNYKSGTLLDSKVFGNDTTYNKKWYTFGPYNPSEGEYSKEYGGYVIKLIADGITGNDGNLYKYFMSVSSSTNKEVEGGNAFTFEYTFRLNDSPKEISHIYPYVDDKVISVKQANFDWDDDGYIRIISTVRQSERLVTAGDNKWARSEHKILPEEKGASLDVQFLKNRSNPAKNNNVVFYITNQYGEFMPFFTVPIGGIPKYKYEIKSRTSNRN